MNETDRETYLKLALRRITSYNVCYTKLLRDFRMSEGTPVHAARGGIVARVVESNDKGCWEDGCGQYANFIVIMHDDGTTGEYYHLQQDGALIEVGDKVVEGQKIGYSGNTGHTALPHSYNFV